MAAAQSPQVANQLVAARSEQRVRESQRARERENERGQGSVCVSERANIAVSFACAVATKTK